LPYGTLLGSRACAHMAAAAWASGFLHALMHTANTFSLPLCHGNALGQFFCEVPQILKLSCSHLNLRELRLIVISAFLAFGCFVFIFFSYVQIFRAVLRIPSEQGRHKAFSTCLPHLAVVSLFLSTSFFTYLKPPSMSFPSLDLALSVLYSVVPPFHIPNIHNIHILGNNSNFFLGWKQGTSLLGSRFFDFRLPPPHGPGIPVWQTEPTPAIFIFRQSPESVSESSDHLSSPSQLESESELEVDWPDVPGLFSRFLGL
ncbi:olfactory receptor 14J1-like, partial [Melospiza melodia melodia]|uniref:olfactory receptor 14J1-like n=1 Tax=Melospiza melodia melodia TaxID=1914991 RepID=UPI002FD49418